MSRLEKAVNSTEDRTVTRDTACRLKTSTHEYLQDLEPHLNDTYWFLETKKLLQYKTEERLRTKRNYKLFLAYNGRLLDAHSKE